MADETEPTIDAKGKRAQNRLRDMLTTAVGLVDRPANEEVFLVVKSHDGASGMTTKADDDKTLKLPADAKQSLTDGLADALERLAALAQQVEECEVDDTAECPPELATEIDELADDLDELADEFMPKASPTEMKAKGAARKANKVAKAAMLAKGKPFPGAAPPFGKDGKPKDKDEASENAGEVAKEGDGPPIGSPPGQGAGKDVPRDPPGEGPGAEGSPQPRGTAENPDVVMKSGRKMAKERLDTLHKAFHSHKEAMGHLANAQKCMKSVDGSVGSVLKDVWDGPGFMQPPGAPPEEQPPSPKPPPAEPVVSPRAIAPDTTSLAKSVEGITKTAVDEALKTPLAELNATLASLKATQKSLGESALLGQLRGNTGTPRSQPNDGPPPAPPAKPRQVWPSDMSAEIKQKRKGA